MARMRYPSLSLHGIEGAFSESGTKTVIPAKVIGKFSLRLVPDMTPDKVVSLVEKYVMDEWKKIGSKNTIKLDCEPGGKPWLADPNHWNYEAAIKATEKIYGVKPDLTREGGSIPVALTIADILKKNLLLLPLGRADDGAHSTNE
jgi:Cys-Gly metallodipeptidase DUG1